MSIILSNLSKSYGAQKVLHEISFSIGAGETVSFLGPNGAGKSTCMKILTGGLAPDGGTAAICGYDITARPLDAKRCTGYLPENNPLYPEMYVREYLEFTARLYRLPDARARVARTAERVGLTQAMGKLIGTLSKGYRQRVGLAQALLHDPQVLILDEPFSGLDPNQLDEIHSLVRELGKEKAILFSSHTLSEVTQLCSRTLILNRGKIVADAPVAELTGGRKLEELFKELTHENYC